MTTPCDHQTMCMSKRKFNRLLAASITTLALPVARAQGARRGAAELAQYEGTDREQRLVEGAKSEGVLSIYTSA
jgi:hypothetical protein